MNVAIFGGTFDPIHRGHLALARAAKERFQLGRVLFIPADVPPHKQRQAVSSYWHRYAMVALATAGESAFMPSPIEAPRRDSEDRPSYSIETVRRIRKLLPRSDRLFFLIGIDSFLDIGTWYKSAELLQEVEFIVASRPGFSLADVASALPEALRPPDSATEPFRHSIAQGELALGRVLIHFLPQVRERVSATQLRAAAAKGRSLRTMVPESVAEYIRKMRLYRPAAAVSGGAERPAAKVVSIRAKR